VNFTLAADTIRPSVMHYDPATVPPDLVPPPIARIFDRRFAAAHDAIELHTLARVLSIATEILPAGQWQQWMNKEEFSIAIGAIPAAEPFANWILEFLASEGLLERERNRFRARAPFSAPPEPAVDQTVIEDIGRTRAVVDKAAAGALDFIRGRKTGEEILFDLSVLPLWFEYFDNDNPLYSVNNRLSSLVLADHLSGGERIGELGGGAGSAALAFCDEISSRQPSPWPSDYFFTEPVPAFGRRGARALRKRLGEATGLRDGVTDFNIPLADQGWAPDSFDVIWSVNAVHVAIDLPWTLAGIRAALRPGGLLLLGECIRPWKETALYTELGFNFLESWRQARLGPNRSTPGFLTAEEWRAQLTSSGFETVAFFPDIERVRDVYPKFLAAAIVARRPK